MSLPLLRLSPQLGSCTVLRERELAVMWLQRPLAVVAEANGDLRALDRMLRQRMPGKHPTVFGRVATIPRNRMGKVERRRLTDEFRRRLSLD